MSKKSEECVTVLVQEAVELIPGEYESTRLGRGKGGRRAPGQGDKIAQTTQRFMDYLREAAFHNRDPLIQALLRAEENLKEGR